MKWNVVYIRPHDSNPLNVSVLHFLVRCFYPILLFTRILSLFSISSDQTLISMVVKALAPEYAAIDALTTQYSRPWHRFRIIRTKRFMQISLITSQFSLQPRNEKHCSAAALNHLSLGLSMRICPQSSFSVFSRNLPVSVLQISFWTSCTVWTSTAICYPLCLSTKCPVLTWTMVLSENTGIADV